MPLTKVNVHSQGAKLTKNTPPPFIVSFRRKLLSGYRLVDLEKRDMAQLQKFLDVASELSIQEMEKRYRHKPDRQDKFDGKYVEHYGFENGFRIHGIFFDGRFEVIRIDPNHKKHK